MKRSPLPFWLPVAILATALLSLYSISKRVHVEGRNKAVSIAAEYEAVESCAAAEGLSMDAALAKLKSDGLGAIVLSEESIQDLMLSQRASIGLGTVNAYAAPDRVLRGLSIRFPGQVARMPSPKGSDMPNANFQVPRLSSATLRAVSVGLDPMQAGTVRRANLTIVARMSNPPGVTSGYVRETLRWANDLGAKVFLPLGDQVLGRRDALDDLVSTLRSLGMFYASPEFAKLGGDENVVRAAPDLVIRLHSAQSAELDKLPLDDAVDRYSRAARERGMRMLLVRPVSFASPRPLASLGEFIRLINRDVQRQGLSIDPAHPYEESNVPTWLFLLIGLSLVPTAYFVGSQFVRNLAGRVVGLVLVTAIGVLAATHHGRPYAALMAAIVFPIAAFLVLDAKEKPSLILDFVLVSLVSLVGGLAVAGLLNSLPYFVRAEQFEGVKLAVFFPIFVVLLYFLVRQTDLKALTRDPVTWGSGFVAILLLGMLAFMSSRTGNDNPAGVSDLELKFRFLLDQVLLVRPRTKEVFIGHPLLVIGIGLLALQRLRPNPRLAIWTALALAGGAIGQTDIVNTMCHIHTPVLLSLMRIGVGMVAGCIIGLAVWVFVRRSLPAGEP